MCFGPRTEALARKPGNALVAPVMPVVPEGTLEPPSSHMRYPGTIGLREETFAALLADRCESLRQYGFRELVLIGDHGSNQQGTQAVAERLQKRWRRKGAMVQVIPEYYSQNLWGYEYLKTLGTHQQPDVRAATRSGVHNDYPYEAILATINPELIRTEQRLTAGLCSLHGMDMSPPTCSPANLAGCTGRAQH